jgi:Nif11 domain
MAQTTVANFIQAVKEDPSSIAKLKAALDIESYYKIAKEKIQMNHAEFTDKISLSEKKLA